MRKHLQRSLKLVDELDHEESDMQAASDLILGVLSDTKRLAAQSGLPDVVELCNVRVPVTVSKARVILSRCLAACPADTKPDKQLTPPAVAKRYKVSPDTVRLWIESGKLKAINLAQPGKRPRYRITEQALAEFDSSGQVAKPVTTKRRSRAVIPFKRY